MSKANENESKEKFSITVESKEPFPAVAKQDITTSTRLGHLFSKLFDVFEDFEGVKIEVNAYGQIGVAAYFRHADFGNDALVAFCRDEKDPSKNDTMERIRRQRRIREEGVKFYPTKEAKEAFEDFLLPNIKNQKSIDWNRIVADETNPTPYGTAEVLSKIQFIDPVALLREIYGTKNDAGHDCDYKIDVISSKHSIGVPEYIFSVTTMDRDETDRAARDSGIVVTNALGIIK